MSVTVPETERDRRKPKAKVVVFGVAILLLLAGAGGGWYLVSSGEDAPPEPGAVVVVDPITLNLADGHYLKIGVALQATVDAAEEPEPSRALDIIIATLSNRAVEELKSAEGRDQAKGGRAEEDR